MNATPETRKSLGVAACTAIVVGNMVGSGFYLSPAAVAPYGMLAVVAWIVMGAGAICLGLTFARLARAAPPWRLATTMASRRCCAPRSEWSNAMPRKGALR